VRGSNARWSPTGDRIAYTAQAEPRGTQIFVRYMDAEGAISQITRVEKAPSGIAWSPDGTRIGFAMNVEAKNTWNIRMPRAPEGAVVAPAAAARETRKGSGLQLVRYRPLFSGAAVERVSELQFQRPAAEIELAADDARERGIAAGEPVRVSSNGTSHELRARINRRLRPGAARVAVEHAEGLEEHVEVAKA